MSRIATNLPSTSTSSKLTKIINEEDLQVIELNVGGIYYSTTIATLLSESDSLFHILLNNNSNSSTGSTINGSINDLSTIKIKDSKNKLFLDRDGVLFRYVLDYLRNKMVLLPENFNEKRRLKREAEYFKLPSMIRSIEEAEYGELSPLNMSANALQIRNIQQQQVNLEFEKERSSLSLVNTSILPPIGSRKRNAGSGTIVIGYRGTFAFGREGLSDVKFRKISRILVCGRVQLCREVFGDTLNESRDPDHGVTERYTSRFYLKHTFLELAFDTLTEYGFFLVGTCATGANSQIDHYNKVNDSEESRWLHYNEFIFFRT